MNVKIEEKMLKGGEHMDTLEKIMGLNFKYEKMDMKKKLPLFISGAYEFKKATSADLCFILIRPLSEIPMLPALKRQILRIQETEKLPVALELDSLSFFRKKSFIENNIPFIIKEKQIYLPFLGTYLTARDETDVLLNEKFMPATQVLFLWVFYGNISKIYLSEASKELPYSAMTITRAAKQLEATGLVEVKKEGVNKVLFIRYDKKAFYKKAKKYFISPIVKKVYIAKEELTDKMLIAGETALAEISMLDAPVLKNYAIFKDEWDKKLLNTELIDPEKQICLELWQYNPYLFTDEGRVDFISMIASLKDNIDERIELSIEEALEEYFWGTNGKRI